MNKNNAIIPGLPMNRTIIVGLVSVSGEDHPRVLTVFSEGNVNNAGEMIPVRSRASLISREHFGDALKIWGRDRLPQIFNDLEQELWRNAVPEMNVVLSGKERELRSPDGMILGRVDAANFDVTIDGHAAGAIRKIIEAGLREKLESGRQPAFLFLDRPQMARSRQVMYMQASL